MSHTMWLITGMFLGYLLWGNRKTESDKEMKRRSLDPECLHILYAASAIELTFAAFSAWRWCVGEAWERAFLLGNVPFYMLYIALVAVILTFGWRKEDGK